VILVHNEHKYFGDSDLEYLDNKNMEELQYPEESKSECKSEVS
jgi:hypothetical protein